MGLSTSVIIELAVTMVAAKHDLFPDRHLDISSGHGDLIQALRRRFNVHSSACDYTDTLNATAR